MPDLPEIVVTTPTQLAECVDHLATCEHFGFDTEFIGERSYHPHLCLVQVASPERLYLLDPLAVSDLTPFWELVADPGKVTVVHAGREEIRMCFQGLGRPPGGLFDLQVAAGLIGAGYPAGHGALVHQFFKVFLKKGETLTDWTRRPLTKQQVRYAYDDVRYLIPLYHKIHGELSKLGRLPWAVEEHELLTRRAMADDPDLEPWRKLRGLGSLDRKKLAVVREVFLWREKRAAAINRPARFILRDDLVVELAKRAPREERELTVMRGMPRHDLDALLQAIERGVNAPAKDLPEATERDRDPPQVQLISSFLLAVLGAHCTRERLTPSLVTTSNDVKLLVRARLAGLSENDESNLSRGWRREHILPVLNDVLDGKRAIRIGDIDSPSPFIVDHA